MDGWRRPNHMLSQIGRPKAMPPVNFRRLPGGFHSVAKQASFHIASGRDFKGFRRDFGRFWEAKMEAKIYFCEMILPCFFRKRFGIDFGWFFGGSQPEKSIKTMVFSMVFANFHKIHIFEKVTKKPRFWLRFRRPKR